MNSTIRSEEKPQSEEVVEDIESEATGEIEPISYFGTDFDVHGLVRRLNSGEILIPSFDPEGAPDADLSGFQRGFVWKKTQMVRFVESLLLGLPIPGIFLVQQEDKRLLVLDGQQRLKTLQKFYARQFELKDVVDDYEGLDYERLQPEDRRTLDNTFIHATIVKYKEGFEDSVYQIFERLNTGGTNLYPHEIRIALYGGKLVEFIRDLNDDPNWRELFGPASARLKDQELILRFLALYYAGDSYERPLKSFLNKFTKEHRNLEGLREQQIRDLFSRTSKTLQESVGRRAFRPASAINAAFVDAVMVGMARRLESRPVEAPDPSKVQGALDQLLNDEEFQSAIGRATADEERVRRRLERATAAFRSC